MKIVGIVRFSNGVEAKIDDQGIWHSDDAVIQEILRSNFGPDRFGPAEGFPAVAAVSSAVRSLGGRIVQVPPIPEVDEEIVY